MRISKKTFSGMRWKIVLTYLLIISLAFLAITFSVTRIVEDYLVDQRVKADMARAETLAATVAQSYVARDADGLYEMLVASARQLGGRALVLDRSGVVQADSHSLLNGRSLPYNEVNTVLAGEANRAHGFHRIRYAGYRQENPLEYPFPFLALPQQVTDDQVWVVYYTADIVQADSAVGVLLLSVPIQDVLDRVAIIRNQMLFVMLAVGLVIVVISLMVSEWFTKPIKRLTGVIEQMSRGKLKQQVTFKGNDEIATLGRAFNEMSTKVDSLDRLRNEFVSNVSHELRTPLSSMKILMEALIQDENPDPVMTREFLVDINGEIDRLNAIITDLLTIVRMDDMNRLKRESVDISALLEATVHALQPLAASHSQTLNLQRVEGVHVQGDGLKLRQVLSNLVDNAIKYTPAGGTVNVSLITRDKWVAISVADTGIGIPEADIPHIFERFYRVDKARSRGTGGTGLGLAIVKQIVDAHDGTIDVRSTEGAGSVFTVMLPLEFVNEEGEE